MSEQECVGVIVKFTHGNETRKQTLPAVESLTELKDIAFELFDANLPEDFMLAYIYNNDNNDHDDHHHVPFLLTSDRSFKEAERLAMRDVCVVNGLMYSVLNVGVYGKDDHDLPSPREDLLFDDVGNINDVISDFGVHTQQQHHHYQQQQQQQSHTTAIISPLFPLSYSNDTNTNTHTHTDTHTITSIDPHQQGGESLDGIFQVEKALDVNFDDDNDPDDVDDYEHDGFMSDQNGFMPDDTMGDDDDDDSDLEEGGENNKNKTNNLSKQNTSTTAVVSGYGVSAVGVVFSALKTALLAPTFFCSSCTSASSPSSSPSPSASPAEVINTNQNEA